MRETQLPQEHDSGERPAVPALRSRGRRCACGVFPRCHHGQFIGSYCNIARALAGFDPIDPQPPRRFER